MAMSTGGGGGVKAEPNVTPMIDVMLVLLIIFMIVTPLINAGFAAVPPSGINLKSHPEDPDDQVLGIDRDGQYYLNKRPIKNETLGDQLKAIFEARTEDKILYLKADRNLKYSKVLDAIDIAAHNGVRVLGAISDQAPGTSSTVPEDQKKAGGAAPAPAPTP
ncbi:MAG TPA: biopolymer transporter ExbD [Gemmatimonadaceae bacterium]|nr:biopolymer transporter ExbD [Gemmatimonadaceae bacterium]